VDVAARLEAVEQENDMLRERLALIETEFGMRWRAPLEFRLSPQEELVFGVLMAREMMTVEMAMAALYHNLGKDPAEKKIVDVFICKIRKKIKPFGVEIKTVWGRGYLIDSSHKRAVNTLLRQEAA
jgi:two-component system cell cycle response regulator CtrA